MGKMELTFPCEISTRINPTNILKLVKKLNQLDVQVFIETNEKTFNAKSLLSMWLLVASITSEGTALVRTFGPDAEIAMEGLENLFSIGI